MKKILDLGMHPFADTFISEEQYSLSEPVYPLVCIMDPKTGEIKLKYETKDDERYGLYNYSYTSSNSKISRQHWKDYCRDISENITEGSKILEIGSNDGFLTRQFMDRGYIAKGVDPSTTMCEIALESGVETYNCLFNSKNSKKISRDFGPVDAIIANNVFNHANDVDDFMRSVSEVLSDDGMFVFELPYWLCTIRDKKFDQIYHEHVTYFTVKFSYHLLRRHGFEIQDVQVVDYHGGSLRVLSKKKSKVELNQRVKDMIFEEEEMGLFKFETYETFLSTLKSDRNSFMSKIYKLKSDNIPIIGIGAAAKANTFLNFYKLDNTILDFITDSSEHKKGKYTPLSRIPICGDDIFGNYERVCAIILSWNISDMLVSKIREINHEVEFLSMGEG